jgi:F-type H+-transporting ATPase subunit delta
MAKLVATTYGDALFDLAVQESKIDDLYQEAQAVIKIFEDNGELGKLLNHPKIEKQEKESVIENIFGKAVSKDMTGLLVIMVAKDRQNKIIDTLKYFLKRIEEYKKIGTAYVSSARPLTEEQKKKIVDKLLATTKYVEFNMHFNVDETLIGGMIIRIGDRVVDNSIKTKLDELTKDLKKIQLA